MALVIDNCLIPQGSGTNQTYGGSCCDAVCQITNNAVVPVLIEDFVAVFNGNFSIQNLTLTYESAQVVAPFLVLPNTSFQVSIGYCAGDIGLTDTLTIEILSDSVDLTLFNFDFQSIDLDTSIDETSIDFGTVNVNSVNQFQITINNPTTCCYNYEFTTDCADTIISPDVTGKMCFGDTEVITFTWTPTTIGSLNCNSTFIVPMGQELILPVTGTAVEAPSGGGSSNGQKNKIDQTTRVEACSPRTSNNRCETAKTIKSAIKANARRFGKR